MFFKFKFQRCKKNTQRNLKRLYEMEKKLLGKLQWRKIAAIVSIIVDAALN